MQIRTTVRYHITSTRVTLIKMTNVRKDVEKLEASYIVDRSINGVAAFKHSLSVPHLLEVLVDVSFLEKDYSFLWSLSLEQYLTFSKYSWVIKLRCLDFYCQWLKASKWKVRWSDLYSK